MRRLLVMSAALLLSAGIAAPSFAKALIADLSDTKIEITTSFTGSRLLLFGALDREGDVIVTVRGPDVPEVVRKKQRIAGIWINGRGRLFTDAPGFYFVAASRKLSDIAAAETLRDHDIGFDSLELGHDGEYRDALIRLKKSRSLYAEYESRVRIIDGRLFRAALEFPASVPTGPYRAEVHLFRDGKHINSYAKMLNIHKAGIEAAVFDFAHTHSALYGIIAVIIALLAGWFAGVVFRRT